MILECSINRWNWNGAAATCCRHSGREKIITCYPEITRVNGAVSTVSSRQERPQIDFVARTQRALCIWDEPAVSGAGQFFASALRRLQRENITRQQVGVIPKEFNRSIRGIL